MKTGYDTSSTKRLPDCLMFGLQNVSKSKALMLLSSLLYYDVDSFQMNLTNKKNKLILNVLVLNVSEDIPFFLEILAYDEEISDAGSVEYAKVKLAKSLKDESFLIHA